ncbi:hypothetical protein BJV82DRAFT_232518 [Fennellomyces sp. T-0311]|nr:hypothetical protein BJV82DRAFT_232518 [Fennellomyces sp. T-0311]
MGYFPNRQPTRHLNVFDSDTEEYRRRIAAEARKVLVERKRRAERTKAKRQEKEEIIDAQDRLECEEIKREKARRRKAAREKLKGAANVETRGPDPVDPDSFRCPCIGCSKTYAHFQSLTTHMKKVHSITHPGGVRGLPCKSPSGEVIDFKSDNCRDKLKPGDEVSNLPPPPKVVEARKRTYGCINSLCALLLTLSIETFYCPCQGCDSVYGLQKDVLSHLKRVHAIQYCNSTSAWGKVYMTPKREVIHFTSENCRNMLEHGSHMLIEVLPKTFYCPYMDCHGTFPSGTAIYDHFKREHNTKLPNLRSAKRIFKTPSGEVIHLENENCRNMLKVGDAITVERANQKQFYCPYRGCLQSFNQFYMARNHILDSHSSRFPRLIRKTQKFKTSTGDVIDFENAKCRNMLDSKDTILVEYPSKKYCFCPYEGCETVARGTVSIFKHIQKHCPENPMINQLTRVQIKNSSGDIIDVTNERCRNMLKDKEVLTVKYLAEADRLPFCCPYKNCTTRKKFSKLIVRHIRNEHDPELPPLKSSTAYCTPEDSCYGALEEGEIMVVVSKYKPPNPKEKSTRPKQTIGQKKKEILKARWQPESDHAYNSETSYATEDSFTWERKPNLVSDTSSESDDFRSSPYNPYKYYHDEDQVKPTYHKADMCYSTDEGKVGNILASGNPCLKN